MLYLVATPIGNLSDITFRSIEILKNVDYILCEDTRHSRILLDHFQIDTPLKSYHQFSEAAKEASIIKDLKEGKTIALISDAGTPGISDPGERIVKKCREEQLNVIPIPGACAAISALSASGLDTSLFQFAGFLPRKANELRRRLIDFLHYEGTTICYESPNRIEEVLKLLKELAPQRTVVIARELTKKFEEFLYGTSEEIWNKTKDSSFKGEITLLIEGDREQKFQGWLQLSPEEHVQHLMESFHLSQKDAIKLAAELRGVPKKEIYREFHE